HEIGRIPAEPYGAAVTGPTPPSPRPGKNGTRWAPTATGPTPGPPPPCGMQNVLCRFRCETSAPKVPGRASPTSAFRLAPSTYTWPPAACTSSHTSPRVCSNTPLVDG